MRVLRYEWNDRFPRDGARGDSRPTCFNCGKVGHKAECLQLLKDCAALNMAKSKEKRKIQMDKGCKLREFKEGEKVLYRIPGLCSKLSDSCGCYVVGERMGSVNYKIYREGKKKSAKVIHVNCLKKYLEGASICRLDVVVEDDTESKQKLFGECEGFVKDELEELLV